MAGSPMPFVLRNVTQSLGGQFENVEKTTVANYSIKRSVAIKAYRIRGVRVFKAAGDE